MGRFLGIRATTTLLNLSTYSVIRAACTGSQGSDQLTATGPFVPGQRLFIIQIQGTNHGKSEDNYVVSYAAGVITLLFPLEQNYSSASTNRAQVIVVPEAGKVIGSLTVPAWDGSTGGTFVISCSEFRGTILANGGNGNLYSGGDDTLIGGGTGGGFRGGYGERRDPFQNRDARGQQGEGYLGAGTESHLANANGGGAGIANHTSGRSGGGGGGNASGGGGGQATEATYSQGGLAVGTADLSGGIYLGGGGGGGGGHNHVGSGASGGGIIGVYAQKIIEATLRANGGVGAYDNESVTSGGGGGAGGTIFIRAMAIINSIGLFSVNGGGSGPPGSGSAGGAASSGRIRIEACSLSPTTGYPGVNQIGGHVYCGSSVQII